MLKKVRYYDWVLMNVLVFIYMNGHEWSVIIATRYIRYLVLFVRVFETRLVCLQVLDYDVEAKQDNPQRERELEGKSG